MLFGMFKEKEVIDNTNFDTTKGDIVEDFGGAINNQNSDKDLIPLTSFNESHSEEINYQNIDLNNPQMILNSINGNSNELSAPTDNNYQNQNISSNNIQSNIPNYNSTQQFNSNLNYSAQINPMPQNVVNNVQPINSQNTINTMPNMVNPIMGNQSIQPMSVMSTMNPQMNNSNNSINEMPINYEGQFVNQNLGSNNLQPPAQENPSNSIISTVNNSPQNIQPSIEQQPNNNIDNTQTIQEVTNSPVEILTEVKEKGGISNLTSTLLGGPIISTNNQQINDNNVQVEAVPTLSNEIIKTELMPPNLSNQNTPTNNLQPIVQENIINTIPNTIDTNIQNMQPIIEQQPNNNIDNKQEIKEVTNSPVEILTEVKEKAGISNLTPANILNQTDSAMSMPEIQNINNEEQLAQNIETFPTEQINLIPETNTNIDMEVPPVISIQENIKIDDSTSNNIMKSIDDEIKNSPIPSMILGIPETNNIDNIQPQNIENSVQVEEEVPPTIENKVEEITLPNTENKIEEEHKFIINDNIDVEPGFKICPKCGQKIRDDYRLCFVCGTYF